jgi:hypothetical protein
MLSNCNLPSLSWSQIAIWGLSAGISLSSSEMPSAEKELSLMFPTAVEFPSSSSESMLKKSRSDCFVERMLEILKQYGLCVLRVSRRSLKHLLEIASEMRRVSENQVQGNLLFDIMVGWLNPIFLFSLQWFHQYAYSRYLSETRKHWKMLRRESMNYVSNVMARISVPPEQISMIFSR